jgi:hypothetical protein
MDAKLLGSSAVGGVEHSALSLALPVERRRVV